MWVCICNGISDTMLKNDPTLIEKVGTSCGKCKEETKDKSNRVVLQRQSVSPQGGTRSHQI